MLKNLCKAAWRNIVRQTMGVTRNYHHKSLRAARANPVDSLRYE